MTNEVAIALAGAGLGAGAMCLLDPSRGRRRRARLGEAAARASHRAQAAVGMTVRDLQHRLSGLAARTLDQMIERALFGATARA